MKRRRFTHGLAAGTLGLLAGRGGATSMPHPALVKPPRLKKGDTVGLITPGSAIDDEALEKAVTNIESLGLFVKLGEHVRAERGFTAGTDSQRLDDLHRMFADEQVAGVWCARGGYGCSRLLPKIDYPLIARHPKVLIGYSDITALLQAILLETGLVGFHGPVGASDFTDYTRDQVTAVLMEPRPMHIILPAGANLKSTKDAFTTTVLQPGKARGPLAGGNLSLLAALAGTPYGLNARGRLLFIEDIGEKPYRIDRMLTQLRQTAELGAAAGIALGVFADCEADPGDRSLSLADTLKDRLGSIGVPVVYGLSFGHIQHMCTLPIGLPAELDTETLTITLRETGVS